MNESRLSSYIDNNLKRPNLLRVAFELRLQGAYRLELLLVTHLAQQFHAYPAPVDVAAETENKGLEQTALALGLSRRLPENFSVRDIQLAAPVVPGRLDVRNASCVVEMLRCAALGALDGHYSAVVTGPVQKSIISEAGLEFTGHTEFFASLSGVKRVVMMLMSGAGPKALRVALATTHLPLKDVPKAITAQLLDEVIDITHKGLIQMTGCMHPRIAVTGLNPHAGESGHMGTEEIEVIAPAIERARARAICCEGPWPADAVFVKHRAAGFDAILCMYHDQGLPALKREGFGQGINVTLGLPWIRTSVDHGTALDIAGKSIADEGSLLSAIELARQMCAHTVGAH